MQIQAPEYAERGAALARHVQERGLDGAVLFDPAYVLYYTGFAFVPTERPMAFALDADGNGGMLVPRLEREHAQANSMVSHVADYPEYPSETHPMESLQKLLREMSLDGSLGADHDGYPWVFGYRGPALSELTGSTPEKITFQAGDVLVTGASAPVWGYLSELERTMVIGEPSAEQREMFGHMVALQDIAFEAIKPGAKCSDVHRAVRAYYDEHGLWEYWKHHVCHCIGLRYHEAPFLDIGDDTEIKPGMVLTVEPGLYVDGLGGFRHSDTVAVTDDGMEFLTYYPRDLDSLTLPT